MTGNEGDGFLRFQARIEAITEALGEPALRTAVAKHFSECLQNEMRRARGLRPWGALPWSVFWTMATTSEFNAAADQGESTLSLARSSLSLQPVARAKWRGATLVLRGNGISAEGGRYRLSAFRCFMGSPQYSRRLQCMTTKWQVSADKDFLESAGVSYGSGVQTTHAGTEAAGVKAMRRMVKTFLGVELVDL